jgi:RNA polymerase sigma factor (TIGR02999 family)
MSDVTRILHKIDEGDPEATEKLLPVVYDELRRLASQRLANESPGQTLQATALVHEAYLRLVDTERQQKWDSRGHFFAAAAEAMRRILVENARRKGRIKHGGQQQRVELQDDQPMAETPSEDLLALDEALANFEREQPDKAQLIKLRYFAGLTEEQAAEAMGISRATASRYWTFGRAWLYKEIGSEAGS